MSYEIREAREGFRIVCVISGREIRVVSTRATRDDADREAGDLNRFARLLDSRVFFEAVPRQGV
jgi:hypothetical protein